MNEKKKKIVISTCLIIVLILAVIGVSYAAFSFIGKGSKVNQITTGTISMNYKEKTNVIRLNNALPTTDATGKVRLQEGEYFDFSVTTNITGDATINWEIAAEDFPDNTFDGSNVKFYLTKLVDETEIEVSPYLPTVYKEQTVENKNTGRPANMMSLLTGSTNTQGEETINYRLRLYVDENYNPQGDGGGLVFKTRINVYGKVTTSNNLMMKTYVNDGLEPLKEDFHQDEYSQQITKLVTKGNTNIPDTAVEVVNGKGNYFDISEARNDSVIAYLEENGTVMINEKICEPCGSEDPDEICETCKEIQKEVPAYTLTIGSEDKIIVNTNASNLFSYLYNLKEIDLTYLDTSNVTDMFYMFYDCSGLTVLNLDNFDTSKVTNMSGMFEGCNSLTSLDLSNFDTSKVTDMSYIFNSCTSLSSLTLNSFNTSKVTNMSGMFRLCNSITNLDIIHFNTSNVTDMSYMFAGCSGLTSLNVTNFDTSKVTNMEHMFGIPMGIESSEGEIEGDGEQEQEVVAMRSANIPELSEADEIGCMRLMSIDVSNFNTSNVINMSYMFSGCSSLTNLDLRNFDTSKVTNMSYMFYLCTNLSSIEASNKWTSINVDMANMFLNCGCSKVTIM